jgi:hypothetical protein
MIELVVVDNLGRFLSFWKNFLNYAHNVNPHVIYNLADRVDEELRKYNGVRVQPYTKNWTKIEFEREEDATLFLLRFA